MTKRPRSKRAPDSDDAHWRDWFVMITRGFVEEYSLELKRNEWVLYLALATFYNRKQKRSFPTLEELHTAVSIDRSGRSRAMRRLAKLGLIEVWSEKRGRHRGTFYRLLHVDENLRHMAERQQPTEQELRESELKGELPEGSQWLRTSYRKGYLSDGGGSP